MNREFLVKFAKAPVLYPEADEFQVMPNVFATGFMVGLIEWTCIQAVRPHLDWPAEQAVGIHIDVSHLPFDVTFMEYDLSRD